MKECDLHFEWGNEEGEYPKRFLGTGFIAIDSALDVFDLDY